jgi:tRNA G18 (ribose-2'-O)-methylase SpoU
MLHSENPAPPEPLVAPAACDANIIRCNPETLPDIIHITDPEDPRIGAYVRVRERDLVGRRGGFIAEGEVVLNVLLGPESRCKAASLLVAEKRLERLGPLIERLPSEVPIYAAGQAVMDAIVGFHIHRGIMAHGVRPTDPGAEPLLAGLGPRALVLVLFGISNHDNMGGLFRNAAAFGADSVLLDAACCDPLYRKAIRVSVGAALKVPFARLPAGEDPLTMLERTGFTALALSPGGAEPLAGLARPERAAVLLGTEGAGLDEALLLRARTVAIPMAAGWDSLNVAAASAVMLHELTLGETRR